MFRKITLTGCALGALAVVAGSLLAPLRVGALPLATENYATDTSTCPGISDFDWPSWVKEADSTFDYKDSSYIIFMDSTNYASYTAKSRPTTGDPGYNWTIFVNSIAGKKLTVTGDKYVSMTSGVDTKYHGLVFAGDSPTSNGSIDVYTATDYNYKNNPASTNILQRVGSGSHPPTFSVVDTHSYPYTTGYPHTGIGGRETGYVGNPTVGCVVAAHNVNYVNFIYAHAKVDHGYTAGVGSATSASESCSTLNIGCWLAKAYENVADTMSDIAQATMNAFAILFMPDTDELNEKFEDYGTYFSEHIGFLGYPFIFFNDLFDAVADDSGDWCYDGHCSKNFGEFQGADFIIDFAYVQNHWPTAWNWAVGFLRATTVLGLVFGLKKVVSDMLEARRQ